MCDVKTEAVPVDTDGLPEKYLVIQAAEMVRLRYILLYVDQTDEGKQAAGGWTARIPDIGTLVVVLYGLVLLCIGLAKNMNLT